MVNCHRSTTCVGCSRGANSRDFREMHDDDCENVTQANFDGAPSLWMKPLAQLVPGCPGKGLVAQYGNERKEDPRARAGEVVCCDSAGRATRLMCEHYNSDQMKTFGEAYAACSANGLRLCEKDEVRTACTTGCGLDNALVWVLESTAMLVDGCSQRSLVKPKYEPASKTAGVTICCGAVGKALRIRVGPSPYLVTYAQASAVCSAAGLRLCQSQEEVDTSCSGGGFDHEYAWIRNRQLFGSTGAP